MCLISTPTPSGSLGFQVKKENVCGLHWKGTDHSRSPPCRPCLDQWSRDPSHADCREERGPALPEREPPSSRGRDRQGSPQRCRALSGAEPSEWGRGSSSSPAAAGPDVLPEPALCSTPARTAHSTRGGTERGYHSRSRSTVWGLCYTDLSIMILGSPIQGIRCRPCSWYWAFSSSRNSLQA